LAEVTVTPPPPPTPSLVKMHAQSYIVIS